MTGAWLEGETQVAELVTLDPDDCCPVLVELPTQDSFEHVMEPETWATLSEEIATRALGLL